jgi:hypothetical protein
LIWLEHIVHAKQNGPHMAGRFVLKSGGEGGIRTLGTLLTYTRFPGVRLQPLGHLTSPATAACREARNHIRPRTKGKAASMVFIRSAGVLPVKGRV